MFRFMLKNKNQNDFLRKFLSNFFFNGFVIKKKKLSFIIFYFLKTRNFKRILPRKHEESRGILIALLVSASGKKTIFHKYFSQLRKMSLLYTDAVMCCFSAPGKQHWLPSLFGKKKKEKRASDHSRMLEMTQMLRDIGSWWVNASSHSPQGGVK